MSSDPPAFLPTHPLPNFSTNKVAYQKILVIDDDCDDTDILEAILKELSPDHHIQCLNKSGDMKMYLDALKDEELPTLIILDYNMPVMSGCEMLQMLKHNIRFASASKIIYSATLREVDVQQCLEAGAIACFRKATSVQDIKEQVNQMLLLSNQA